MLEGRRGQESSAQGGTSSLPLSVSSNTDRDLEGGHYLQAKREKHTVRARRIWTRPSLEKSCLLRARNFSEGKKSKATWLAGCIGMCQTGKKRGI